MRTEPVTNLPSPSTAPLARDPDGRPIPLPDGAAAWRIRRHTGGRPKLHLDASKQPMLFPLHYNISDAEEILPPGTYRLDLIDAKGDALEITVAITIGATRNANESARDDPDDERQHDAISTKLPATGSDVRLVLEANIRATQLAFQHNERTLATSLRMAETLRDGVHVLAESQADWIKSVASSRGFFRNAGPAPQLAAAAAVESIEHHEEQDDDDEPQKDDRLLEFGMAAMTLVNNLIESFRGGTRPPRSSVGFDLRSLLDWRRAAPQADGADVERPRVVPSSPADAMRVMASLPPELLIKLQPVRERLSPDEQAELMPIVMAIGPDDLPAIAAELMPKSVDEIAAIFRAQITKPSKEAP